MTPRQLDPDTVVRRLSEIDRLLDDLERVGSMNAQQLETDRLLCHGVERVLAAVVDLAVAVNSHVSAAAGVHVPHDYASSFASAAAAGALPEELAAALAPSDVRIKSLDGRIVMTHRAGATGSTALLLAI